MQRASAQPAAESCHPQKQRPWQGTVLRHTGSSPEPCEFCSVEERREPSPTGGFACQALSVSSVHVWVCVCVTLSASSVCVALCLCVCVCESSYSKMIMLHTHVSVNVDSVTHWVSHTFQNKRLPLRITIDPCRALSCIWKERR